MQNKGTSRGSELDRKADKMREIVAMLGWLKLLYLVCVFMSVCLMKSNSYSFIYSSLGTSLTTVNVMCVSHVNVHDQI